ncbi:MULTISPECIES: sensor domain-containing diguanylate cyclase [Solibacillus]|uniref:GGDEF domain-containing protein n=1 Tax=Solibacillus merdavium TaxID=2762218 RepID=A0ABR8XMP5_9BACL|nr:GGDEF domain-containing protein [Solibacillus merdavium]MBD8033189.1 GGDEF domain-containing protein [Solibacillus merdavium]
MEFTYQTKRNTLLLWVITGVPIMGALYFYFPSQPIDLEIFVYLLIFGIITTAIPFQVGDTTIVLSQWVTLTAFLLYGIGAEMIIVQFSLIPIIYQMRNRPDMVTRVLFISWMFVISSFLAAGVVHLLGFEIGNSNLGHLLLYGSLFALIHLFANHLILFLRDRLIGIKEKLFSEHTMWDYSSILITLPFSITLVIMINELGIPAIFLLGVPFFVITFVVKMYNISERVNYSLSKASAFGHELADRLSAQQIVDLFIHRVSQLFPHDAIYIVDHINGKYVILRARIDRQDREVHTDSDSIQNSFISEYFQSEEKGVYGNTKEWMNKAPDFLTYDMNSIMIVPIHRNQRTEGVVLLTARKKNAFEKYQMDIVHLLSTYFAVSLEKAKYISAAVERSETCALTGLYNYRYVDRMLAVEQDRILANPHLQFSLLMMDIDHFKRINDTYGHHAGNIVLKEFAKILESFVPEGAILARYGGEEFVMLIPHMNKSEAAELGEKIRQKIEIKPFLIESDLTETHQEEKIHITVSIGVSNVPEDTDEMIGLLRNADRALYIGAKQAGRNKVAEYVK